MLALCICIAISQRCIGQFANSHAQGWVTLHGGMLQTSCSHRVNSNWQMTGDEREAVKSPAKAGWNSCGWHIQYIPQMSKTKVQKAAAVPVKSIYNHTVSKLSLPIKNIWTFSWRIWTRMWSGGNTKLPLNCLPPCFPRVSNQLLYLMLSPKKRLLLSSGTFQSTWNLIFTKGNCLEFKWKPVVSSICKM